jgi:hypothetical protein
VVKVEDIVHDPKVAGKRTLTMKATDMDSYLGVRAKHGGHLPRGFLDLV